jgi:hypothetical protein
VVPARQVGATDRAGEQQVAGEHQGRDVVLVVGRPEGHRSLGVAGRVVDGEGQPGHLEGLPVSQLRDVVGLGEGAGVAEQHPGGVR